jgi:hypothetical protein
MQNNLEEKIDNIIMELDILINKVRNLRDGAALKIKELEELPSRLPSNKDDIPPLYDDVYCIKK